MKSTQHSIDITVWIIDDDEDLKEVLMEHFRGRGFKTRGFANPLHALKDFQTTSARPDAVISDLRMPQMDGVEFITKLKEYAPHVPVILITAYSSMEVAIRALRAGAADLVIKPMNFNHLDVTFDRCLKIKEIEEENSKLKESLRAEANPGVLGKSPAMKTVYELVDRIAPSKATVLITGESGTGKEVIAKRIHALSSRAKGPFLAINCSAIPENLLESELFGHTKGAFTGAADAKVGLFEAAHEGTLFLDEIGDLNLQLQAKILRAIQERKIRRVGENKDRAIEVRLLAATLKNLRNEVREKRFREDLYFRLNVIPITIPPLRQRKEDILPLAEAFLRRYALQNDKKIKGFDREASEAMLNHNWPGNVRELENAIERAVILSNGAQISAVDLFQPGSLLPRVDEVFHSITQSERLPTLAEIESIYIDYVIQETGGAKEKASKILGIDRKTLYRRLSSKEEPTQEVLDHPTATVLENWQR